MLPYCLQIYWAMWRSVIDGNLNQNSTTDRIAVVVACAFAAIHVLYSGLGATDLFSEFSEKNAATRIWSC